jgi:pimeloyl-ACP methyl ester carboxylesterase
MAPREVRQQEVGRRLGLAVLAALLVVPVARVALDLLVAALFVVEFLSAGHLQPLSALTGPPGRQPVAVAGAEVDRWARGGGVPLVLVHGYAPAGKDEPRVQAAAALLARAGFDVLVPTIPGLMRGRLRPEDANPVVAALATRSRPSVVLAVSVGAGPALLAAADPDGRDRVAMVLSLGGYASAPELLRFFLTGDFRWQGIQGHVVHDPAVVRGFLEANADLLDTSVQAALIDPSRAAAMLAAPPAPVAELLDRLSPERVVATIRAPLVLVHGVDDRAVPYTESLRLAAARPEGTRVVLVRLVEHVEGTPVRAWPAAARELGMLVLIVYGLGQSG